MMMSKRGLLRCPVSQRCAVGIAAVVAVLGVTACGSSSSTSASSTDSATGAAVSTPASSTPANSGSCSGKHVTIGFVMKDYVQQFWVTMRQGAVAEAAKNPCVKLITTGGASETDNQGQIAKLQALVAQGVNAIIISPVSSELIPVMTQARSRGIPLLTVTGSFGPGQWNGPLYGPDVAASAAAGARFLVNHVGLSKLKARGVAIVQAPNTSPVVDTRFNAVEGVFKQNGIPILGVLNGGQCSQVDALNSTETFLQAHPNVAAIFTTCNPPDLGAVEAVQRIGKKPNQDIYVMGYDGSPAELQAIQKGTLTATVSQVPSVQGQIAVQYAVKAAEGQKIPNSIVTPFAVVDAANVAQYVGK